ncbi:MAG: RNA polymerase Rpb4 family protein [Methanobrevibacter wolinii]|uniref:RNA polymerase Rpb4 family protein n=1 Tax=Methanobrevibacter wolinii TaxID=190977 RepID=UPI0005B2751E|nr:RNA polymerase Rpb4 family protein [Methanobrevibacter wolinii]MDD5960253.1 RNA polymerase Rpb4 family protein [Methanobrevibacter wolinii]
MIGKKTVSKEPIPAAKVKRILEEFSENNDLSYEQNITLNHVLTFNKLSEEDTYKMIEELEGKLPKKYAVRVADLLPKDLSDMRLIFAKERISLSKEDMEEILEIVDKYVVDDEE